MHWDISWGVLDGYVFGPVALIRQVMTTYRCKIIRMAPGRLAVSWFWDLVDLSTKVPLRLLLWVNLLTQSFATAVTLQASLLESSSLASGVSHIHSR